MSVPCKPVIILVEPRGSANIGMVARAMANFGVDELRLVNPCPYLDLDARKYALNALPLLEAAQCFPDLEAALADLHYSIATTRRLGQHRDVPLELTEVPGQLATLPAGARIGLVFGREDTGLTTPEVARCSIAATIATDPGFASLNLAQAVLLFLYELARAPLAAPVAATTELPTHDDFVDLFALMEETLTRCAFLNDAHPDLVMNQLRRLHHASVRDRDDLNLLRGMWAQLGWSIHNFEGRKRGGPRGRKSR
jgi:tRNA/rRNA methyltransferase